MPSLELLAPAKDISVGIAAIDCGADAVYIAGPAFGNRKNAGNSLEDIAALCEYAHRFGVRVYITVNTLIYDGEWDAVHEFMTAAQQAGADAFIFREEKLLDFPDIVVPMHASTQCSIRSAERARHLMQLGCSRIILERGLSLSEVREICSSVDCEVEFFVHGALCVCYSGECRLSQYLDGRSADRGECIQACRSLYDLADEHGNILLRDKALLSLRDFKLLDRLEELADAGVCSFKIEGRLKNASYVKNVVREYSLALDELVSRRPAEFKRASFGRISDGFTPDSNKTFNRGYTQWWIDGKRGKWSCMDAPKSMGEYVGTVESVKRYGGKMRLKLKPASPGMTFSNGDGFAFSSQGVHGFRGDRCEGTAIECKYVEGIKPGLRIFRNIDTAFEKTIESGTPRREVAVDLKVRVSGSFIIEIRATTEDGRSIVSSFNADVDKAENRERAEAMLREQLSKRCGSYIFRVSEVSGHTLPLLSSATINSMRRLLASDIPGVPPLRRNDATEAAKSTQDASAGNGICIGEAFVGNGTCSSNATCSGEASVIDKTCSGNGTYSSETADGRTCSGSETCDADAAVDRTCKENGTYDGDAYPCAVARPLMRTKYCIRYELGMCPRHHSAAPGPLYLLNCGRKLTLNFDCSRCEMTVG